ncbi:hypothetical protein BG015_009636 [Linnemannia schmuckeri]|uniref:Uncharacterized protein n=1 Tax=Linnemannia schmuckeri TaxID=64567 RepID=A0A9P5RV62_9FUNG|nr:hypothetical protein BG015_009636 [Linnemannia schmuckeri]
MRPTITTTSKRLFISLVLIFALLSSSALITTANARVIPQKRAPDSNDDNNRGNLLIYPPGHYGGHTPFPPHKDPGSFHTNKRRKRSDPLQVSVTEAQAEAETRIEKRNLFSRLLNTDRLYPHRRPSFHHFYNLNVIDDENDENTNGSGGIGAEEYSYWNSEEEEEEEIDEEDDLERHGGIYEDDDDDEGGFEDVRFVNQMVGGASTPIVIEPFIHHSAHGSSLFDTDGSSSSSNSDQEQHEDSSTGVSNNSDSNDEGEDFDRIRASQPLYQHQYLSSSKHHTDSNNNDDNILKNQIWIVDEWDEDFDGVEETIDDFVDWIDDLDHVRARPASSGSASAGDHSGNNYPLRHLFF